MFFGQDMILTINNLSNWIFIRQRKQAQIEKCVIRKNSTIINQHYRVGYQVMVRGKKTLNMKHHLNFRMKLFKRVQT